MSGITTKKSNVTNNAISGIKIGDFTIIIKAKKSKKGIPKTIKPLCKLIFLTINNNLKKIYLYHIQKAD